MGAPGGIRTPDPLVRSQMLWSAELRAQGGGVGDGIRTHNLLSHSQALCR